MHLVGHSMGGQTVRQLEELLRNGSQEVEYQKHMVVTFLLYYKVDTIIWFLRITTLGTA